MPLVCCTNMSRALTLGFLSDHHYLGNPKSNLIKTASPDQPKYPLRTSLGTRLVAFQVVCVMARKIWGYQQEPGQHCRTQVGQVEHACHPLFLLRDQDFAGGKLGDG